MRQQCNNDGLGGDELVARQQHTIVYNDFNLALLATHTDGGQEQQQETNEADKCQHGCIVGVTMILRWREYMIVSLLMRDVLG
jgi:hypothetical protein